MRPPPIIDRDSVSAPRRRVRLLEEQQTVAAVRRSLAAKITSRLDWLAEQVVLFRCGEFVFVTFGFLASLGALLSLSWMGLILAGEGVAPLVFTQLALYGSAAVVLGSWVLAQVLEWRLVWANPRQMLRRPVFVSWGGLAGVIVVLTVLAPREGVSALLLLDAATRAVPLGHALGRLGCLSYGCCFGRPTAAPLAIHYRSPESKAVRVYGLGDVPLQPAPLYEAVLQIVIFAVVNTVPSIGAPVGVTFAIGIILYGGGRFAIESVRDERDSSLFPPLTAAGDRHPSVSVSRVVCAGLVIAGAMLLPLCLLQPTWAPSVQWSTAIADIPALLPAIALPALLVFGGFAVHRRTVGRW